MESDHTDDISLDVTDFTYHFYHDLFLSNSKPFKHVISHLTSMTTNVLHVNSRDNETYGSSTN